jgi:thiamine-monophosphate kinase
MPDSPAAAGSEWHAQGEGLGGGLTIADLGETAVIERIRARLPPPPPWVLVGPGDDAAVVEPARNTADVLTTDVLVEGIHFDRAFSRPDDIGFKALAVNLSDLAAMGAAPRTALLSLVLPAAFAVSDLDGLLDGFLTLAARAGVSLVGGNIARSPGPLIVSVAAGGSVRRRKLLVRSGARPGDQVYVSGSVGDGAAGLAWLRREEPAADPDVAPCVERYRRPHPRLKLGALLGRTRSASACVDLSDGLSDGLRQIASASDVGILIEADRLPISSGGRRIFGLMGQDPVTAALAGGDDYELLFTVPKRRRRAFASLGRLVKAVPLARIGQVVPERGVRLRRDGRETELPAGFTHFQPS